MDLDKNILIGLSILCLFITIAGCTYPYNVNSGSSNNPPYDQKVTDAKVVMGSTLSLTSPTLGNYNQSPELLITPYLTDSSGQTIIGGFSWPENPYNITIDYEIWTLNCSSCDENKLKDNKGILIFQGKDDINKWNPSTRLDFGNLVPSNTNNIKTIQSGNIIYAVTENQRTYPIIDLMQSYAIFAKITTPDGRTYQSEAQTSTYMPPIENIKLGSHYKCIQESDCNMGWACCYGTCTYDEHCA